MRVQVVAKWKPTEVLPPQEPGFKRVSFLLLGAGKSGVGLRELLEALGSRGWPVPETAIDLAVVAFSVYSADMGVPRAVGQDSWTREILVDVPVSSVPSWEAQIGVLTRLLNYLTGDRWFFRFRERAPMPQCNTDLDVADAQPPPGAITLFSGGLDSCVGAIDTLSTGAKLLCVSHAGDGFTSGVQRDLVAALCAAFPDQIDHLRVWYTPGSLLKSEATEKTTRGRSFLFFAAAAVAAAAQRTKSKLANVLIPENGFISLNVPLDPLRLGAQSTRTTHPYVLRLWNQLLQQLDLGVTLGNPYQFSTKGEMFASCANTKLLKKVLPITMSCSSPTKARWKGLPPQHCGHCVPCIIRRAAVRRAFGSDTTEYSMKLQGSLDPTTSEGRNVRAFQRAIRVNGQPRVASVAVHASGPLDRDPRFADMYVRGLNEVKKIVEGIKTVKGA